MSKWEFGCGKKITVFIPSGYAYKPRERECGSTAHDGGVNQCDDCEKQHPVPAPYADESDADWYERATDSDSDY
jgi:hypothetical protein